MRIPKTVKFDEFLIKIGSYYNNEARDLINYVSSKMTLSDNRVLIAGGILSKCILNDPINDSDIDLFEMFRSPDKNLIEKERSQIKFDIESFSNLHSVPPTGYQSNQRDNSALTYTMLYKNNQKLGYVYPRLLPVRTSVGYQNNPYFLFSTFDIDINQFATDGTTIWYFEDGLQNLLNRQFTFHVSNQHDLYQITSTMKRVEKYIMRGFQPINLIDLSRFSSIYSKKSKGFSASASY